MRPSDYLSGQSVAAAVEAGRNTPVDETIARFLATSAVYFSLPAERLEQLKQHSNFNLESKEQS
jgi:hypothetical protein